MNEWIQRDYFGLMEPKLPQLALFINNYLINAETRYNKIYLRDVMYSTW